MNNNGLIIRLDGHDNDAGASSLLIYARDDKLEVIATEEDGADAVVILTREQVHILARALMVAADAHRGQDAS